MRDCKFVYGRKERKFYRKKYNNKNTSCYSEGEGSLIIEVMRERRGERETVRISEGGAKERKGERVTEEI